MKNWRELFLIVGVLAVFCGIGAGAANRATRLRLRCADHLRQLLMSAKAYENDHGVLPPVIIRERPRWKFYDTALEAYVKDPLVFTCPADARNQYRYEEESPLFQGSTQLVHSYGMNRVLEADRARKAGKTAARLEALRFPEKVVIFGDATMPYIQAPGFWKKGYAPRHEERANFIFGGGEVRWMSRQDFGDTAEAWQWN